jgi:hypothetical protein
MAGHRTIDSINAARALARLLNGDQRVRPIVVVTIPTGREQPWIDVGDLAAKVGDLAEVYLMPTNAFSWELSHHLPPLTQVYGGAGRVYPVGHDWVRDPYRSPLRFAYDRAEGHKATNQLVDDALRMATAAGLLEHRPATRRVRRTGTVLRIMAERALVRLDRDLGAVPDALAFSGVPLERCLAPGMQITGLHDPDSGWFDVRESRLDPADALAGYRVGDLVLAQVETVSAEEATVFLHPLVTVGLRREQVTSNDLDDLRGLMSPNEVLAAHVTHAGPAWELSLLDVDDDEIPVRAASLFAAGPPWLEPPVEAPVFDVPADSVEQAQPAAPPEPPVDIPPVDISPVDISPVDIPPVDTVEGDSPPLPAVSPMILDHNRHRPKAPGTPSAAVRDMSLTIATLQTKVQELSRTLEQARERSAANEVDLQHTRADLRSSQDAVRRLEQQLRAGRVSLRKARNARQSAEGGTLPRFADPERGFRLLVELAWARRIPPAEQGACPLPEYLLAPDFLDSLESLEGVSATKVADVAMEVLTGKAAHSHGREVHRLRESAAGNAPYVVRESDSAQAMRVNLQTNTPSARRLHYWVRRDGTIELAKVGLHDDYTI